MRRVNNIPVGGGYVGRTLVVDLCGRRSFEEPLDLGLTEQYLGGRGCATRIQYERTGPEIEPLDSDNVLMFSTGPLTGLGVAGNRFTVAAKSPLTGILGDSNAGGPWGVELKRAGYDMVIIKGKAESPVYLKIEDRKVEIRDAKYLWGKGVYETEKALRANLRESIKVASIGPAGERLVKFASIITELSDCGHAAARTGMGAVMGSKNLKAIVVRGTNSIPVARPSEFKKAVRFVKDALRKDDIPRRLASRYGTTQYLSSLHQLKGGLATRNWQESWFEHTPELDGETLRRKYHLQDRSCFSCPQRCTKLSQVSQGRFSTRPTKVEFFMISSFGPLLGNADLASVIKACELCNDLGLDCGDMGASIAFVMECFEKGLINTQDTDGIVLKWGDPTCILKLIRKTAYREGFCNHLAEGLRHMARFVGKGSERFAMHMKGMSLEIMDPRVFKVYRSGLRTASRGGDHLRSMGALGSSLEHMPFEAAIKRLMQYEVCSALHDMLGVCKFPYGPHSSSFELWELKNEEGLPRLYSCATGIDKNWADLAAAAERLIQLERAFNTREGKSRKDDEFPERLSKDPVPRGPFKGHVYDISDRFIDEYYKGRGWDEQGLPFKETLDRVGLSDIREDLEKRNLIHSKEESSYGGNEGPPPR